VKDPTSLYLTCELHCEQSFLRRYQSLSSTQNSPPFMEPNASILTGHPVTNASCSQGSNVKSPVAVPPAAYSRGSGFKSWFVSRISRLRLSLFFSGPPGKFWNTSCCDLFFPHSFPTFYSTFNLSFGAVRSKPVVLKTFLASPLKLKKNSRTMQCFALIVIGGIKGDHGLILLWVKIDMATKSKAIRAAGRGGP
jgi:hypothetical protein